MRTDLSTIADLSSAIRSGRLTATNLIVRTLNAIRARNSALNAFTKISEQKALAQAAEIDARLANGAPVGALAGIPFAAKELFDIAGEITTAGAKLREHAPEAATDAPAIARLKAADAIYVGRLNMDEFAYGFATVNAHFGTTRNPYDLDRLAGGSSGGSAAAVAADLVPITLGSDTNGSVRVPASLCGLFGLRPTHGSLPISGVFPFVEQLDTLGPFTRTLEDLTTTHRVLAETTAPSRSNAPIRVARLDGWFRKNGDPGGNDGVDRLATVFGEAPLIDLPLTEAARSAAFLITSKYGGMLHEATLRTEAMNYDPAVRDRLIAGIALSDVKVQAAHKVIAHYQRQVQAALSEYDVLIAPTTPSVAPKIAEGLIEVDGKQVSARANLGLYTQPLSVTGVPILSVPLKRPGRLPLGVQLVAKKDAEEVLFHAAEQLVDAGLIGFTPPASPANEAHS
jgi:aspartyl-tRNA(Asn)/glutamyl-tRNA(Gln) amidotransferase subunit A